MPLSAARTLRPEAYDVGLARIDEEKFMATFTGSDDLRGAKFTGADLRGARFVGTDLSGVVMRGVSVQGQKSTIRGSWTARARCV